MTMTLSALASAFSSAFAHCARGAAPPSRTHSEILQQPLRSTADDRVTSSAPGSPTRSHYASDDVEADFRPNMRPERGLRQLLPEPTFSSAQNELSALPDALTALPAPALARIFDFLGDEAQSVTQATTNQRLLVSLIDKRAPQANSSNAHHAAVRSNAELADVLLDATSPSAVVFMRTCPGVRSYLLDTVLANMHRTLHADIMNLGPDDASWRRFLEVLPQRLAQESPMPQNFALFLGRELASKELPREKIPLALTALAARMPPKLPQEAQAKLLAGAARMIPNVDDDVQFAFYHLLGSQPLAMKESVMIRSLAEVLGVISAARAKAPSLNRTSTSTCLLALGKLNSASGVDERALNALAEAWSKITSSSATQAQKRSLTERYFEILRHPETSLETTKKLYAELPKLPHDELRLAALFWRFNGGGNASAAEHQAHIEKLVAALDEA